jgi:DNA-binding NarL/FixJ family response regulator
MTDGINPFKEKIRVMIVEDDPEMRKFISQMVTESKVCEVVCEASSYQQAADFIEQDDMDLLLVDLELPDGSGLELIRNTSVLHPTADVVVITVFGDEANVFRALENGAAGYLLKDSMPDDFVSVVQLLRSGGAPINPIIARQLVKRFHRTHTTLPPQDDIANLSAREVEILNLIARGFSTMEVAKLIELSQHTVVSHIKKVYRKLRVNSRSQALYEANLLGVLSK